MRIKNLNGLGHDIYTCHHLGVYRRNFAALCPDVYDDYPVSAPDWKTRGTSTFHLRSRYHFELGFDCRRPNVYRRYSPDSGSSGDVGDYYHVPSDHLAHDEISVV